MLYIAYGSNLNKCQMSRRCPAAIPIGPLVLPKARLVFRGVADVEYSDRPDDVAHCGLWYITRKCEFALDAYEGVSSGLYRKEYITLGVTRNGVQAREPALIYLMNRSGYGPPGKNYYKTIKDGFADFGLDDSPLIEAVSHFEPEPAF